MKLTRVHLAHLEVGAEGVRNWLTHKGEGEARRIEIDVGEADHCPRVVLRHTGREHGSMRACANDSGSRPNERTSKRAKYSVQLQNDPRPDIHVLHQYVPGLLRAPAQPSDKREDATFVLRT